MNEESKNLVFDWKKWATGIDFADCCGIKYDDITSSICSIKATSYNNEICAGTSIHDEIDKLKTQLKELEDAKTEDLVCRDDKIKRLEAEVAELNAKIEYCKKNGIWVECTQPSPSTKDEDEDEELIHLFDGLELD